MGSTYSKISQRETETETRTRNIALAAENHMAVSEKVSQNLLVLEATEKIVHYHMGVEESLILTQNKNPSFTHGLSATGRCAVFADAGSCL